MYIINSKLPLVNMTGKFIELTRHFQDVFLRGNYDELSQIEGLIINLLQELDDGDVHQAAQGDAIGSSQLTQLRNIAGMQINPHTLRQALIRTMQLD